MSFAQSISGQLQISPVAEAYSTKWRVTYSIVQNIQFQRDCNLPPCKPWCTPDRSFCFHRPGRPMAEHDQPCPRSSTRGKASLGFPRWVAGRGWLGHGKESGGWDHHMAVSDLPCRACCTATDPQLSLHRLQARHRSLSRRVRANPRAGAGLEVGAATYSTAQSTRHQRMGRTDLCRRQDISRLSCCPH